MSPANSASAAVAETQKLLSASMGQYRAEYIEQDVFKMFSPPTYWSQLIGNRPCILVGGRGTGKTTALRGLSFQGQYELCGPEAATWDTVGTYWRMASNVVTAFKGERLSEENWIKLFSHYVNLQMVYLFLEFAVWRKIELDIDTIVEPESLKLVCSSISIEIVLTLEELTSAVAVELANFEVAVNSIGRTMPEMHLSLLGKPIQFLLDGLRNDPQLSSKSFTYCIDEYENLSNYQQKVFNTLIKHVGDSQYTFKVGMRRLGHRDRTTLVEEPLSDPADFTTIDIIDHLQKDKFSVFAAQVCNNRLHRAFGARGEFLDIERLLPSMTEEEEAKELGIDKRIADIRTSLVNDGVSKADLAFYDKMSGLSAYLVDFWALSRGISKSEVLKEAISSPSSWETRRGNYAYSMLFTIRRKVRGPKKYYSGWATFIQLANGNIRYLLQLVFESLIAHTNRGFSLEISVSAAEQTQSAVKVGEIQVNLLQGLSAQGGQLTRMVLGLGRIFEVMANSPHGHAAEVNQFRIEWPQLKEDRFELESVVNAGIMHSALVSFIADKKSATSGETNAMDYFLHPIFAAYFGYSHRRKRRMVIRGGDLLNLMGPTPNRTIEKVLLSQRRRPTKDRDLPEQLSLYSEFYFEIN